MNDNNDKQPISRKDPRAGVNIISSIILMIFSAGVFVWSLYMPRPSGWPSAPGVIPLFVSTCLFFMALQLLVYGIRKDGISQLKSMRQRKERSDERPETRTGLKRSLWIVLLVAGYIFVLLERIPFEIASFIYMVAALYVFWRKGGWLKILIISAILPFFISFMFRFVFHVLVPGESVIGWIVE